MFINMAVLIWMEYRKFNNMPELKREGDYLIISSEDRRNFDNFRDLPFYKRGPVISTPLLLKYMNTQNIPVTCEQQFGRSYVMSMPTDVFAFDKLVKWARKEFGLKGRSHVLYVTSCICCIANTLDTSSEEEMELNEFSMKGSTIVIGALV